MIKLSNGGAYLINGTEVIEDGNEELLKSKLGSKYLSKEEAGKNTIAYGILKDHNTSGSMDKLHLFQSFRHPCKTCKMSPVQN